MHCCFIVLGVLAAAYFMLTREILEGTLSLSSKNSTVNRLPSSNTSNALPISGIYPIFSESIQTIDRGILKEGTKAICGHNGLQLQAQLLVIIPRLVRKATLAETPISITAEVH